MFEQVSLIVDILSLCATIFLTFLIYYLQKKDEKKHDRERNEELARNFIIDNQSEINLLPWCMVASNVKDLPALQEWKNKKKCSHQIYLEFGKQPEGVKNEILRQENITLRLPGTSDWVPSLMTTCLQMLLRVDYVVLKIVIYIMMQNIFIEGLVTMVRRNWREWSE
ncbi:hypothetical protein P7D33_08730 [Lactococcus petauri]|jgi:hypothetical protein|uniref:hypothetical protein n=1 Tax=Lactococcus TaxID=1357 RepID=UPI0003611A8F|nr:MULTISPECIES: hypothetical protein [Lactococcus]PST72946.1 hypothetical protein AEH57_00300 [Lactococcus garvieae]MCG3097293.1 hypothetical protein [Lactococcus petauri]MDC0809955.1 hypothetical protein [Lactococcus petauri]MDC0811863.1 hypothetical protein [Lactococcus petauri]MDC0813805.1 hypothetical protein [Lactococcus petauri]